MIFFLTLLFSFTCYYLAKRRIAFLVTHYGAKIRSLTLYYGLNVAAWNLFVSAIALLILAISRSMGYKIAKTYDYLVLISIFAVIVVYIFASLRGKFRAQKHFENLLEWLLKIAAILSICLTISILLIIFFEAFKFFNLFPIDQFLLGTIWSPQEYQQNFGVIPILTGTLLITFIAILVALPLGLLSAIYLGEYTSKKIRNIIKPILELLAGIPTIVYGYFAVLLVGPSIRSLSEICGFEVSTESALAAGLVMGMMIIPFILSLSDDAINSVPQNIRDAALALGSTKAEMIVKVILPASSSGIISSILLAISRAIGETMIVAMSASINAKLTLNPLDAVTTFTVQIVALLVGDQEFDSAKTLSAFALALSLFIVTLFLNIGAMVIIKRNRKAYE